MFEEYPSRLQLPDDRHPGGGRPGTAEAAAAIVARRRALAAAIRRGSRAFPVSIVPPSRSGPAPTGRATRPRCSGPRSARGHAAHARRGRVDAARRDERPSWSGRIPGDRGARRARSPAAKQAQATAIVLPLFHQMTDEEQEQGRRALSVRAAGGSQAGCFRSSRRRSTRAPTSKRCTRVSSRRWRGSATNGSG